MSQKTDPEYAILLLNMGGPKKLSDVQPFLYNLFSDNDIIPFPIPFLQPVFAFMVSRLRAPKVVGNYAKMGGGSPILQLTMKQKNALEKELMAQINCKVHIVMRYTEPFTEDVVKELKENLPRYVVLLPLYPHYSTTTTQSSLNEFNRVMEKNNLYIPTITINNWYDHPGYIEALTSLINEKLKDYAEPEKVHILFSAHGLPESIVEKGDPYPEHIKGTVEGVMKDSGLTNPYIICYQSKVGPVKWLEPSTEDTIKKTAEKEDNDILMVPISFVSDHFETDFEIDIEYAEMAKELGVRQFGRIRSLNDNPIFIEALKNIVLESIQKEAV